MWVSGCVGVRVQRRVEAFFSLAAAGAALVIN